VFSLPVPWWAVDGSIPSGGLVLSNYRVLLTFYKERRCFIMATTKITKFKNTAELQQYIRDYFVQLPRPYFTFKLAGRDCCIIPDKYTAGYLADNVENCLIF
jgi:hypothetical protein